MQSSKRTLLLAGALALAGATAGAETTICTTITALPYTITAQGSYCLDRNLATAIGAGNAITINTDFVVLDLNGFKVGGGSAGTGTLTNGVYALNRKNITIKNGNIRGFLRAVHLEGASGLGHLVEDVRADGNTTIGISVEGTGSVVRNNSVVATTGATTVPDVDTAGIRIVGSGARILNNDVTDTVGMGAGVGYGILLLDATGAVVENNRAGNASLATGSFGVYADGGTDILMVNNRVATTDTGLSFSNGATGKYRDNLTSGVITPFDGGTDAGNNQ